MVNLTDVFEFFQTIYTCIPTPIMSLIGVLAVFTVAGYLRDSFLHDK